jgi:hypothetical protein
MSYILRGSEDCLPGIDLYDAIFPGGWVECILDVALANNAKVTNHFDSSASEHVVFVVGEGLGRCNDDGVTCMCTKRIKIFHIAANDRVLDR